MGPATALRSRSPLAQASAAEAAPLLRVGDVQADRSRYMVRRARSEHAIRALRAVYGETFPGFDAKASQWVHYVEWLWHTQDGPMDDRNFLSEKFRLFREGHQWISSQNGRTWREPVPPRNVIRQVVNVIGPSQEYRLGVIEEQRPGFRVNPHGSTSEDRDAAEAQQLFLEWLYHRRDMMTKLRTAMRYAQDWGVGALQGVWNTMFGERRDATVRETGEDGMEQTVALDQDGNRLPEGEPPAQYMTGDVDFIPVQGDQVRADPEATCPRDARWVQISRLRAVSELVLEHGERAMKIRGDPWGTRISQTRGYLLPAVRQGEIVPDRDRFADIAISTQIETYLAPSEWLPEGLYVVAAGGVLLHMGPLPFGPFIPVIRFTDGGSDPDFFPRASVADWIDDQVAINAIVSRILQNVRMNSGGRLLAKSGSVVRDTFTHTIGSIIEWKGATPPQWLQAAEIGGDTWQALQFHIRQLENKSGWNDVARGQLSASLPESGRGILAIREQFERGMAPFIRAASRGMQEWAEVSLKIAAWGYVRPRLIPIIGEDRPDLPHYIASADLERETDVYVDPETLMPMPRALKLQMLREELQLQTITPEEYRRRAPYASVRNLDYPNERHYSRAKRVNFTLEQQGQAILMGQAKQPPIHWQDDPAIHQQVLNELILEDHRKPPEVIQLAKQRWDWYALLQQAQQGDPNASQQIMQIMQAMWPEQSVGAGMQQQQMGGGGGFGPASPMGGLGNMGPGAAGSMGQNPYEAAAGQAGFQTPEQTFEQTAPT